MNRVPQTCRAAVLTAYGAPLEVREVPVPDHLEPGALLVRTTAATVCATDAHFADAPIAGGYAAGRLPVALGHEMTGVVVAQGEGATVESAGRELALGDRIVWSHGYCGSCESCTVLREPVLCERLRAYMRGCVDDYPHLTGGFSEYVYVFPESGRVKVPDEISDAVAAASSCALRTVVHAFDRLGPVRADHTVAILGSGPLGLFATAYASVLGVRRVITVGGPAKRLELAAAWGADETLDVTRRSAEERLDRVRSLTGGRGADVVVEVSGAPPAFAEGIDLLRRGGRFVVVGQLHTEQVPFNPSQIVTKQATVIGSVSADISHYERGLRFLVQHRDRFAWDDLIDSRHTLDTVNDALDEMRGHRVTKPVLQFT